jgi:hypothetical protein
MASNALVCPGCVLYGSRPAGGPRYMARMLGPVRGHFDIDDATTDRV